MRQYKWCICDMDGTLLNSSDNISYEDEAALKELQQNGVEIMIASGRLDLMVKRYIQQLGLKGNVISCNGGLIRNLQTGEIIYSSAMDKDVVKNILEYCFENQIQFLVYTAHLMLSSRNNTRAIRYASINKEIANNLRFEVRYLDDADMKAIEGMDILKVLLVLDTQEQVKYNIDRFADVKQLEVVSSSPGLVDIMASGTSKGKALKLLAKKQNVSLEDVIAFGDNYNDIDMLECVGMPVAMENSVEELKAVAKHITKSNNESGIAYAINNLIEW